MLSMTRPVDVDLQKIASATGSATKLAADYSGDRLAANREQLILEHLPIVRFIAQRIHARLPQHVLIEDLYSAGVVGLLDAVEKFDSSRENRFRTYAQFRIRGAILDSLRALDWGPRDLRQKGREIAQAIQVLTAKYGRSPSELEISQGLDMDLAAYQALLRELRGLRIGTLHSERFVDSGEEQLVYLSGPPEGDPLFRYLTAEMREGLAAAILKLPDRERLVMTLYYYEESTMKEIGLILGVLESRVSQIHTSAVLHLRRELSRFSHRQRDRREAKPVKRLRGYPLRRGIPVSDSKASGHDRTSELSPGGN
jgi:RNA polymerase sigma factor for flagellar operon FliA